MKPYFFFTLIFLVLYSVVKCTNNENKKRLEYKEYKRRINHKRKEIESFMESNSGSPFQGENVFNGLNYYNIDSAYNIKANIEYLTEPEVVTFKTSDNKEKQYMKSCKLNFKLNGDNYTLYAYKSLKFTDNNFFVPFTDNTNKTTTYNQGRYLDTISIPNNNKKVILDFNLSYFPYCAYNKDFSCILPPKDNHLNANINAGERYN